MAFFPPRVSKNYFSVTVSIHRGDEDRLKDQKGDVNTMISFASCKLKDLYCLNELPVVILKVSYQQVFIT